MSKLTKAGEEILKDGHKSKLNSVHRDLLSAGRVLQGTLDELHWEWENPFSHEAKEYESNEIENIELSKILENTGRQAGAVLWFANEIRLKLLGHT